MVHNSVVERIGIDCVGGTALVDRVSGCTKWIQHGTVLADRPNTRADSRAVAGS